MNKVLFKIAVMIGWPIIAMLILFILTMALSLVAIALLIAWVMIPFCDVVFDPKYNQFTLVYPFKK